MADLIVIVPSKGRPQSIRLVVEAWEETAAPHDGAELLFAVDLDDPTCPKYQAEFEAVSADRPWLKVVYHARWQPMVAKLNTTANAVTSTDAYFAVGFAGDDHRPRSRGWAHRYLHHLRELGTGIVYGNDLVQGERLPTQWAMTADIVRELGVMVPADVEHLYCDNAVLDLGQAVDCIRYLPDVIVEHCHPVAKRGAWDAGYERVNSHTQYAADSARYQKWRNEQMTNDAARVRALRKG